MSLFRNTLLATSFAACCVSAFAQMSPAPGGKAMPSPPATTTATLGGKAVTIKYNSPSMRGRRIMGELVPYGRVWRTGANPATTLITEADLKIGTLEVPAGTYTVYTLPAAPGRAWQLIVNKQTGQWGTEYHQEQDLGRTPMTEKKLASPQEVMSISLDGVKGKSAVLHVRWEGVDESVRVEAK